MVGAGQGGLSAAIYLRLKGHEVTVLEQRDRVGGKAAGIDDQGFALDPGPSIIILPDLYRQVFQDAGRTMEDYLEFERLDPFTRVFFEGDVPLDLPAQREDCLQVLADRYPKDAESMRSLMRKLDVAAPLVDQTIFKRPTEKAWQLADPRLVRMAMQFDVRKTYRELVDSMISSPTLRAFFYGFPSYSGQSYLSKAPGALLIPYYMLHQGVFYPRGGVRAIPAAFRRLAEDLDVQIETNHRVDDVRIENGRVTEVITEHGSRKVDGVVSNLDRLSFEAMLGKKVKSSPSFSYTTWHFGLSRPPQGLLHHSLLIPSDFESGFEDLYVHHKVPQRPILYLNDTTATDPATAPPGHTNLFVVITTPSMQPHIDWPSENVRLRSVVKQELDAWHLGFEESEVVMERHQWPGTFAERDGNFGGSLYGPDESNRPWGMLPLFNRHPEIKNLAFCGGSVQPGAGLPMVTLSGKFAANILA